MAPCGTSSLSNIWKISQKNQNTTEWPRLQNMGDPEHVNAALHALFFVLIVCACLYCDFFIKKKQWFFFPESAASMVLGFVLGSLVVFSLSGIVVCFRQMFPLSLTIAISISLILA